MMAAASMVLRLALTFAIACGQAPTALAAADANPVHAERIFPRLAALILGDTGVPWNWEYGP